MSPYIKTVHVSNFKSTAALSQDLRPLTIITGLNGAGKTTIPEAITVGVLGYLPRLGKTGPDTVKLAGPGGKMTILLDLSTGAKVSRSWTRTEKGLKKVEAPESDAPALPLVCIDPTAFLGANAATRARMIAARFGVEGDPKKAILDAIKEAAGDHLPTLEGKAPEDFSEWVDAWTAALAGALTVANGTAKRMKTTTEGLVGLDEGTAAKPVPAADLDAQSRLAGSRNAELQRLTLERDKLLAAMAKDTSAAAAEPDRLAPEESVEALKIRLETVQKFITGLEAKETAAAEAQRRSQELASQIEAAENRLEQIGHWLDHNPAPEALTAPATEGVPTDPEISSLQVQVNEAQKRLTEAELLRKQADAAALCGESCPTCGAARAHWSEDKAWETEGAAEAAGRALEAAQVEYRRLNGTLTEKKSQMAKYSADAAAFAGYKAELREREAQIKAQETTQELLNALNQGKGSLAEWSQDDAEHLAAYMEDLEQIRADLAAHEASAKYLEVLNQKEARQAEFEAVEKQLLEATTAAQEAQATATALRVRADAAAQAQAQAKTLAEAKAEAEKATAAAEALQAAQKVLKAAVEKEVKKIFGPLLDLARPISAGCLPTELDVKGLEFGRYEGPHFIHLDTFSGSEQACAISALACAMASQGQGIVILDEFNNLDSAKRPVFVDNVARAIEAGTIAQAILLDNEQRVYHDLPEFAVQVLR